MRDGGEVGTWKQGFKFRSFKMQFQATVNLVHESLKNIDSKGRSVEHTNQFTWLEMSKRWLHGVVVMIIS